MNSCVFGQYRPTWGTGWLRAFAQGEETVWKVSYIQLGRNKNPKRMCSSFRPPSYFTCEIIFWSTQQLKTGSFTLFGVWKNLCDSTEHRVKMPSRGSCPKRTRVSLRTCQTRRKLGRNERWMLRLSPFPLAVLKLLHGVAKHVLQRPVERQAIFLVNVEGQHTGQQRCRTGGKEKKG